LWVHPYATADGLADVPPLDVLRQALKDAAVPSR
jgi:hypothetical protein